ncbi:acyltransferase family protein [Microbacterium sp. No. 7]|uniref:acyltransferase family protein n=1 Tax=Microbacterium sp. No. 7 TaxID=1714373 RepID=UPI0006CF25B8|nr:acyltransferase family protein [Microbacterium sp. No. 7]
MPSGAAIGSGAKADTSHFRLDIQGLRAVAVLVVFADHMFGWPAGGFLGVDVFFVISGFLITGLLLREYDRTGRISFKRFYVGRLKRIVPAATVVILFTLAFSWALFTNQRAATVTWDGLWAFLFGANWRFAATGTDYFQQGGAVSPLQHYWSLSVEEQFYFIWPWLLLGLLVLFARRGPLSDKRARIIAGSTIGVISMASFGWALLQSASQPTVAYFSTFTRGWELGVGALIAIAAPLVAGIPTKLRTIMAYAGLVGIFAACFVITPESAWPAPWALLPVASTALVIMSGVGQPAPYMVPLTNRVSVFVGNISYSLYLWHFPVIIFGHALYPNAGIWVYIGIAIVGFALATAQYYALEVPIWKSPLWSGKKGSWRRWRYDHIDGIKYGSASAFVVLSIAVVGTTFAPSPVTIAVQEPRPTPSTSETTAAPETAMSLLSSHIVDGLRAQTWPASLTPSIDEVGPDSKAQAWVGDGCLALERGAESDPSETAARCLYGDPEAPNTAVLAGDSMAISWLPAVLGALGPDWSVRVLTMQQCPFASVSVQKGDGSTHEECDTFHAITRALIQELSPDLVILSQADTTLGRVLGAQSEHEAAGMVSAATVETVQSYATAAARVVILGAPQSIPNILDCYSATSEPSACIGRVQSLHGTNERLLAESIAGLGNAAFVSATPFHCWREECPPFIDGYIVMADGAHLSQAYSARLGDPLRDALFTGQD